MITTSAVFSRFRNCNGWAFLQRKSSLILRAAGKQTLIRLKEFQPCLLSKLTNYLLVLSEAHLLSSLPFSDAPFSLPLSSSVHLLAWHWMGYLLRSSSRGISVWCHPWFPVLLSISIIVLLQTPIRSPPRLPIPLLHFFDSLLQLPFLLSLP